MCGHERAFRTRARAVKGAGERTKRSSQRERKGERGGGERERRGEEREEGRQEGPFAKGYNNN